MSDRVAHLRKTLLDSAAQLHAPSPLAQYEYSQKKETGASAVTEALLSDPNINTLVGKQNLDMMESNHLNHARFMASLFLDYQPATLVDIVLWVLRTYRQHGFQTAYWSVQLNAWIRVLRQELSSSAMDEIYPFYNWLLMHLPMLMLLAEQPVADRDAEPTRMAMHEAETPKFV